MKLRKTLIQIAIVLLIAVSGCSKHNTYEQKNKLSAITFKDSLELIVHKISFERNGLFINNIEYDSKGISWYSRFHFNNSIYKLKDISPPYTLHKKSSSDTLELIKGVSVYKMNISEEIMWSQRKYD